LEETHTDAKRHEPKSNPSDIRPINPPEYQMEVCAPKWKEAEQAVRKARALSSPGPTGVPYSVYRTGQVVPRAWHRAGGVFVPKEKDATSISFQFHIRWLLAKASLLGAMTNYCDVWLKH